MSQDIDETYANDPALVQAREAFYNGSLVVAATVFGRPGTQSPTVPAIAAHLRRNIPILRALVQQADEIASLEPERTRSND